MSSERCNRVPQRKVELHMKYDFVSGSNVTGIPAMVPQGRDTISRWSWVVATQFVEGDPDK